MVAFASLKDYGPTFQVKVISSLLKNKAFLLNVRDILDDAYFEHPGHKWVSDETLKYFDKYHTTPKPQNPKTPKPHIKVRCRNWVLDIINLI